MDDYHRQPEAAEDNDKQAETITVAEAARNHTYAQQAGPARKKPVVLWVILTVVLCVLCSYVVSRYTLRKYQESLAADGKTTVVYQGVSTDNTVTTVSDLSTVVEQVENSVVEVYTESTQYSTFYGSYVTSGAGSGVIYSTDGYILTNNHVIDGATSITVRLHDGSEYTASLVATDADTDIAVLKIEAEDLQPAVLGTSEDLTAGQTVLVIGNPLGTLGGSVTSGIISATSREITVQGEQMTLMQISAAVNPGNSGGGLFNTSGELIGIVNAKYSDEEIEGIGFAIPIDIANNTAQQLITQGYVSGRPSIGISYVSIDSMQAAWRYNASDYGVYVVSVTSANARDGGLREGDLITAVDGTTIKSGTELKAALKDYAVGDTVTLTVVRGGRQAEVTVVLSERTNG